MNPSSGVDGEAAQPAPHTGADQRARWWIAVAVFCVALFSVTVPVTAVLDGVPLGISFLIGLLQCGSVVLVLLLPRTAILVQAAAIVLNASSIVASDVSPWPVSVTGVIASCGFLVVLGLRERWRTTVLAWAGMLMLVLVVVVLVADRFDRMSDSGNGILMFFNSTVLCAAAAIAWGRRREIRGELRAARQEAALEQARREHVEERQRIARELHDVVAHSMSIVHMQATSAPFRIDGLGSEATEEFRGIADSARRALREMRQLLGVLREDDAVVLVTPQPGLADLPGLVGSVGRAGIPVTSTIDGTDDPVDPVAQLTAFRLVQEALSNVARHAPGSDAVVRVVWDSATMDVSVVNGPSAAPVGGPASGSRGAGHGLTGMRERVALLDGELRHGPTADGGYSVSARVPSRLPSAASVMGATTRETDR